MTIPTAIVLDPSEVATNRTELGLNTAAIRVQSPGPDWGDAAISAAMADLAVGSAPVDYRMPNRQIRIPLLLGADGKANFATARANLQQKVALIQREGGWLKRETGLYADIVNATLTLPDEYGYKGVEQGVVLVLEALPDFYSDEVAQSAHSSLAQISDAFSSNTIGSYTFDTGGGTLSVSGGQLVPSSTAEKRLYRSAEAQTYKDSVATLKFNYGATPGSIGVGLILCRLDANNYLFARQTANGFLLISKSDGGVKSDFPGAVLSSASASTDYWIRFRRTGNVLTVERWNAAPAAGGSPATTATTTLTGADATKFGAGVAGSVGIIADSLNNTNPRMDDFAIDPGGGGFTFTETGIGGDHPGRLRLILTETAGADQLGLMYALRSRHYDSATTARLTYETGALTPLDLATRTALIGASLGQVVQHANLGTSWTPVLSTDLAGSGPLTHQGSYRAWARAYTTSATPPQLRFLYDVGDFTAPETNDAVAIPGTSNFFLVDLGEVRIDPAQTGTHRWKGVIQAKGAAGGENVAIDKLILEPLDEYAGTIAATVDASPGLATVQARDEFNQVGGALTGKSAAIGGVWAGAGSANDFAIDTAGHTAQRTSVSDASSVTGRYALSGVAAFAGQAVQADFKHNHTPDNGGEVGFHGTLARYVDTNNWLMAVLVTSGTVNDQLRVKKSVAGVVTQLANIEFDTADDTLYTTRLVVDAAGRWWLWFYPSGSSPILRAKGQDTALATGGALATGKPGIYDAYTYSAAFTRNFDNFSAWVPSLDMALYANCHAELRWDGTVREAADASGSYGPTTPPVGDNPRIPASGQEGRTVEVLVRQSRGDFDQLPDTSLDGITAQVKSRASYLFRQPTATT